MAQPNTITANITLSDKGPEVCVATAVLAEIIERLQGTVTFDDPNKAVISQSPPIELDVIWFQLDAQGVVTNIKYYDPEAGEWRDVVSTDPGEDPVCLAEVEGAINAISKVKGCIWLDSARILERSTNSNNLIVFDSDGRLLVDIATVKDIAVSLDDEFACNVLTKNPATKDLRLKRGAGAFQSIGNPSGDLIEGLVLGRNATGVSSSLQTVDLSSVVSAFWTADCVPTHVQVSGVISIGLGDTFSAGTWAIPAAYISCGVNNSRICISMDSDSTEGSVMNTAIVALDTVNPEILSFRIDNTASSVDWTNNRNEIALYLQALIYSGLDV